MPRIAIVGAGPAGCMLARLLHCGGVDAVVFEGEASPNYRSQGGTLDLHTDTGIAALKAAGLFEEFEKNARYAGEYMLMCDARRKTLLVRGKTAMSDTDLLGRRPEIDRAVLRQMLAESLPRGMIQWGRRVKSVASVQGPEGTTSVTITFADGAAASGFDLVVGADGAWSKVRTALSDQLPLFSGVGLHELRIPDAATNAPELTAFVHHGSIFASGDGRRLSIQQLGDGSLYVGVSIRRIPLVPDLVPAAADNWVATCGYDVNDLAAVQAALLERHDLLADYDPLLQDAVRKAQGAPVARSLYMLPVGFRWTHQRGLTLIGDAAHLMTPFAGEGVNVALDDAQKLAAAILAAAAPEPASADALDDAVAAFEREMWPRTARYAQLTDSLRKAHFFTPGAPHTTITSIMALHVCFKMPRIVHPFVRGLIRLSYFIITKVLGREMEA